MKKKFWVDFSGYVCVEAESLDEAERLFWEGFVNNCHEPFSDDVWDVDNIEERTDGPLLNTVYKDEF